MKKTIGISALVLIFFSLALYFLIYHSDIYLTFIRPAKVSRVY